MAKGGKKQVIIDLKINVADLQKQVASITSEFEALQKSTKKTTEGVGGTFAKLVSGIAIGDLVSSGIKKIGSAFLQMGIDGVKAALEAETSINKLNNSLKATGQFSQASSDDIQDFADVLEKQTTVSAEAIQNQIAYAVSMGETTSNAKVLVRTALDLSSAMGTSLEGSMQTLLGTMEGVAPKAIKNIDGFKGLTVETLRAGGGVEFLGDKFKGFAANDAKTTIGMVEKVKIAFDDMGKGFGSALIKGDVFSGGMSGLIKLFNALGTAITTQGSIVNTFVKSTIQPFISALNGLANYVAKNNKEAVEAANGIGKLKEAYKNAGLNVKWYGDKLEEAKASQEKFAKSYPHDIEGNNYTKIVANLELEVAKYKEIEKAALAAQRAKIASVAVEDKKPDAIIPGDTKIVGKDVNASNKEQDASFKPDPEAQAKFDFEMEGLQQVDAARTNSNSLYASLMGQQQAQEVQTQGMFQTRAEFEQSIKLQKADGDITQFDADLALIGQQEAAELAVMASKEERLREEGRINEANALSKEASNKRQLDSTKATIAAEIAQKQAQQAALMGMLANGAALMQSSNRKAFEVGKASAITQAIISTYLGATQAFTSLSSIPIVGPVLGGVAASLAVANGLMQVQRIKAQQPPKYAYGGWTPGSTSSMVGSRVSGNSKAGDTNLIRANTDELMVNPKEVNVVREFISGASNNRPQLDLLGAILDAVSQDKNMYMDGEVVTNNTNRRNNRRTS